MIFVGIQSIVAAIDKKNGKTIRLPQKPFLDKPTITKYIEVLMQQPVTIKIERGDAAVAIVVIKLNDDASVNVEPVLLPAETAATVAEASINYRGVTYPTGKHLEKTAEPKDEQGTFGFDRSFVARLAQLSDEYKHSYSVLKNLLLGSGAKSRFSWRWETFKFGKKTVARFETRGKTLCLMLPSDCTPYLGKLNCEDCAQKQTPCLFRVRKKLLPEIERMLKQFLESLGATEIRGYSPQDYYLPYKSMTTLVADGLARCDHETHIWEK